MARAQPHRHGVGGVQILLGDLAQAAARPLLQALHAQNEDLIPQGQGPQLVHQALEPLGADGDHHDLRLPDAGQVRGQPDAFRKLQQVVAAGGKKALHMPGARAAIQGDGVAGAVQIPGDQRAPAPAADDGDAHIKIPPAA